LHSSSSVTVTIAAVAVAVAAAVPSRVLVNAAAIGSVAPDGGSGGAAEASATTAFSLSTTTPPLGALTWWRWQRIRMAALMVDEAPIGITTTTMPTAIAVTVAVPVLVGRQRRSR